MDAQPIAAALIYGSTRQGRFCDTVAHWARRAVARHGGFTLETIDPAIHGPASDDAAPSECLERRLGAADAFIVVTPEYNHGYTAALKRLIDSAYLPWQARPVAFVSYGGVSGGLRAVEQLRQVFAELHAVTVRTSVSIANATARFDSKGEPSDSQRIGRAMESMLNELQWWALALRTARRDRPFDQVIA